MLARGLRTGPAPSPMLYSRNTTQISLPFLSDMGSPDSRKLRMPSKLRSLQTPQTIFWETGLPGPTGGSRRNRMRGRHSTLKGSGRDLFWSLPQVFGRIPMHVGPGERACPPICVATARIFTGWTRGRSPNMAVYRTVYRSSSRRSRTAASAVGPQCGVQ